MSEFLKSELFQAACEKNLSLFTHVTAPLWVSLPVLLLILLRGGGMEMCMGLHPWVQGKDTLKNN